MALATLSSENGCAVFIMSDDVIAVVMMSWHWYVSMSISLVCVSRAGVASCKQAHLKICWVTNGSTFDFFYLDFVGTFSIC